MYPLPADFYPERAAALMLDRAEMTHFQAWIEGVFRRIKKGTATKVSADFLGKEAQFVDRDTPDRSCLICFVNRSGSSLLANCLWQTGKMGYPHEWLNPEPNHAVERFSQRFGVNSFSDFLAKLTTRRQTPNKTFATKISYLQLVYLHETGLLEKYFPNPAFVLVTREDILSQAISWAIAAQTNAWTSQQAVQGTVTYDRQQVLDRLHYIIRENGRFDNFFALSGVRPLRIRYEEIAADPQEAVDRVAAHCGIRDPVPFDIDKIGLRVQRNAENARWVSEIHSFALGSR